MSKQPDTVLICGRTRARDEGVWAQDEKGRRYWRLGGWYLTVWHPEDKAVLKIEPPDGVDGVWFGDNLTLENGYLVIPHTGGGEGGGSVCIPIAVLREVIAFHDRETK